MENKTYNELMIELDDVEETLFMIDMIDRWTREDREAYDRHYERKKEIEEKLKKIREEENDERGKNQ